MDRVEFIQYLLFKKNIDLDVEKESQKISDFPSGFAIIKFLKTHIEKIKIILNPKLIGEIDLSAKELLKILKTYQDPIVKKEGIDFINQLATASKAKFKYDETYALENDPNECIIIGIDLGTTNTVASFVRQKKVEIIPFNNGERLLPSVVSINKKNKIDVGFVANNQRNLNIHDTFFSIKRFIGRRSKGFNTMEVKSYPFKVDLNGEKIKIFSPRLNKKLECEEISAHILKKVKSAAESNLGKEVNKCVITVPAYFDHNQVLATKRAAQIAGFEGDIRCIKEPTAAAFAYEMETTSKSLHTNTLVCDLGGGTFDISLVKKIGSNVDSISVLATKGDSKLGGDDYTNILVEKIKDLILLENDQAIFDERITSYIRDTVGLAKHSLSTENEFVIHIPFIGTKQKSNFDFTYTLTRKEFKEITSSLNKKIETLLKEFLADKRVKNQKISKVLAVGGSSRMPVFLELVERITGKRPSIDLNPDEIVAKGAALFAEYCLNPNSSKLLVDVNPLSLGTSILEDGVTGVNDVLIPANTPLPCRKTKPYTTTVDNQRSIIWEICQGERKFSKDNILLGEFVLDNIEKAPEGVPKIETTFEIDMDGILTATSRDLVTKSVRSLKIKNSLDLEEEEIFRLKEIAIKMSEEDNSKMNSLKKYNELFIWKKVFDDIDQPVLTSSDENIIDNVNFMLKNKDSSDQEIKTYIRKLRIIIQEQEAFKISNTEDFEVA